MGGLGHIHYLFVRDVIVSKDQETGETIEVDNGLKFIGKCREQVNGSGRLIAGVDGSMITFNSVIHLNKNTGPIEVGKEVIISNDLEGNAVRIKGIVLRFSQGLLHNRLWV
ncbi:hypothetical protein SAMN05443634_105160 [Chishuiella changwenlii]|uniref:Uncharacterized protein n=1 Tax=Chishuiella changwenlii TaxID=1434701 RepID=A0A1M6X8Y6_9FLAO|nr:hypothetical protein [Chishuiella changwenlii]GGF00149.1 hypothetical protein GCM10010984_17140 [Chishuiella changwenlii]SHL02450.1 hypothetical protein SAMN05443634_105160 [Chishuiella changwenlii]